MDIIRQTLFNLRIWPLILKELRQIMRNRRLVISLVVPPTIQIILFGFALNPIVKHLRLGVVDENHSVASRELITSFSETESFQFMGHYESSQKLEQELNAGNIDAGLVIPEDFAKCQQRHQTAQVQFLVDAVDANKGTIARRYALAIINVANEKILRSWQHQSPSVALSTQTQNTPAVQATVINAVNARLTTRVTLFYNPGLEITWFILTGMFGILLVVNCSLVAAASMVTEKESGTIEVLLMTPASAFEIIIAKIIPLLFLLVGQCALGLTVSHLMFGVPVRGSLFLLLLNGVGCVLAGIGIGTFVASLCQSQQQAQLMAFFVNPTIVLLSGGLTPVEAMPHWLQPFTYVNPVRHFVIILRSVMLKGAEWQILYPHLLALYGLAAILVGLSIWRFHKQLG